MSTSNHWLCQPHAQYLQEEWRRSLITPLPGWISYDLFPLTHICQPSSPAVYTVVDLILPENNLVIIIETDLSSFNEICLREHTVYGACLQTLSLRQLDHQRITLTRSLSIEIGQSCPSMTVWETLVPSHSGFGRGHYLWVAVKERPVPWAHSSIDQLADWALSSVWKTAIWILFISRFTPLLPCNAINKLKMKNNPL